MKTSLKTSLLALSLGLVAPLSATTLTFDTSTTPGLTVASTGIFSPPVWTGSGGGHYWLNGAKADDYFYFASPTLVNSFQMNAYRFPNEWTVSLPTGFTMD